MLKATADATTRYAAPWYETVTSGSSVVLVTDRAGQAARQIGYLPFGGEFGTDTLPWLRRRYTASELDTETGFYYMGARYYDPQLGRFLTTDDRPGAPHLSSGALNPYTYVLDSPTNFIDPRGHSAWSAVGNIFEDAGRDFAQRVETDAHDVSHFFKRYGDLVGSYAVDAVLITGGITLLVLTPFTGSPTLGSMLMGAGLTGLAYDITASIHSVHGTLLTAMLPK